MHSVRTLAGIGAPCSAADVKIVKELRDHALSVIRKRGTWENGGPINLVMAKTGIFQIAFRSRFQKLPGASQRARYPSATAKAMTGLGRAKGILPSGLVIWRFGSVVMDIEWDGDKPIEVLCFRRGEWERAFLKMR